MPQRILHLQSSSFFSQAALLERLVSESRSESKNPPPTSSSKEDVLAVNPPVDTILDEKHTMKEIETERTSMVDLGWCAARLTEKLGKFDEDGDFQPWRGTEAGAVWIPDQLTLFQPASDGVAAQSIEINQPHQIEKLMTFLVGKQYRAG